MPMMISIAFNPLAEFWNDTRYGVRRWLATPLITSIVLTSMTIGIGANLAAFALVDAIYFRDLPISEPERVVKFGRQGSDALFSNDFWRLMEDPPKVFEGTAASAQDRLRVRWAGQARLVESLFVSRDFFRVLAPSIFLGRPLNSTDDVSVVLSYAFWQTGFAGRREAVGETIHVGEAALTIVGITGPEFFGTEVGRRIDLYVPLIAEPDVTGSNSRVNNADVNWLSVFGRRLPSVSLGVSRAALHQWWESIAAGDPVKRKAPSTAGQLLDLLPINAAQSLLKIQFGRPLWLLLGAVILVLLIVCANVATVVMSRTADRETEMQIRRALGASRWSIVRGLLVETLVLCVVGAVAGVGLALWLCGLVLPSLVTPLDRGVQPYLEIRLDWQLVAVAMALVVVSMVACSLVPAIRILREGSTPMPSSAFRTALRRPAFSRAMLMMLGAQVAISFALVSISALLVRSFFEITAQPIAVNQRGVLLASIEGAIWQDTPARTLQRADALLDRVKSVPGVERSSISVLTPLSGVIMLTRVEVPGFCSIDPRSVNASVNRVTSDFFEVFGTRLLSGRRFDERDGQGSPLVAIVNDAFSSLYFSGETPLGRIIKLNDREVQIVGVVETGKYMNLREPTMRFVYVPFAQWIGPRPLPLRIGIRSSNTELARAEMTKMIREFDPALGLEFRNLKDEIDASANRERLLARLSGCLAFLALAVAAIGLYGAFSYFARRRRQEFALRIALGADGWSIRRLVARDAVLVVGVGSVAGLVVVVVSGRFVGSLLFGVQATDPFVLASSWVCLVAVAVIATLVPAVRATRIDPMIALKTD
ncbi:MAG: ABC transporter permease [Vicinamibacterales bacterium]|nr:ABC transporter permease [Vicinamibacterales bacterium]